MVPSLVRNVAVVFVIAVALSACSTLSDNEGSTLTTTQGEQVTEAMVLGKWDLDGERTNTANGQGGVEDIPSDIGKDIFGAGWKFEPKGVLRTDAVVGSEAGAWRIEGTNALVVREKAGMPDMRFNIRFQDGYMYLKDDAGRFRVMEKNKFFGF